MRIEQPITLIIDRRILFHPRALHIRRMRAALWLYLVLLGEKPKETETMEIEPREIASRMGLPEDTIRSWIGHLRKHHYIEAKGRNGTVTVRVKGADRIEEAPAAERFFSVQKLVRSLGEASDREALEAVIARYPDEVIRRALAQTLAVPREQIRRSRTALFLYLLKHHDTPSNDDPRP